MSKSPETAKSFLKALILGIQFTKHNKSEAIKAGFEAKLQGEPELVTLLLTISMLQP